VAEVEQEVIRWRAQAISRWAAAISEAKEVRRLRQELAARRSDIDEIWHHRDAVMKENDALREGLRQMHASTSWRVTKPLRLASALARLRRR
jgi:hypothetical protein